MSLHFFSIFLAGAVGPQGVAGSPGEIYPFKPLLLLLLLKLLHVITCVSDQVHCAWSSKVPFKKIKLQAMAMGLKQPDGAAYKA